MPHFNSPYSSPRARSRSISRVRVPQPPGHSPPMPPHPYGIEIMNNSNHNRSDSDPVQKFYGSPPRYPPPAPPNHHQNYYQEPDVDDDLDFDTEFAFANNSSPPNLKYSPRSDPSASSTTTLAQSPFEALKARLLPLRHIEALLIAKLVPPNEDEATHLAAPGDCSDGPPSPTLSHSSQHAQNGRSHGRTDSQSYWNQEIFVRPGPGWKGGLARAQVNYPGHSYGISSSQVSGYRPTSAGNTGLETPDEPQQVLHSCRRDMMQLWNDEGIREVLWRRKIRLEEGNGL